MVSAIREQNGEQVIQTNAAASSGSSGGPLLDKKGKVIGIMSYVKIAGQNLNFAATAVNAKNLVNDNTITKLTPFPRQLNHSQLDSIIELADGLINARQYKEALDIVLPTIQFANSAQSLTMIEQIANAYFFDRDYSQAMQYYELLSDKLHHTKPRTDYMVWVYAQALHKSAVCHYTLNDKEGAVDILVKAEEVTKAGFENDSDRKELYQLQLQQIYLTDALYKHSLGRKFEACLSWKKAKRFGHKAEDYSLEEICD